MESLLQDVRYALRGFARTPQFTLVALAALTLGIGTNTAVFSVVNAVLLKPVPFPDPDRLVMFMNTGPQGSNPAASPAKFAHWRQQTSVTTDATAFRFGVVNYTGGSSPEQLRSGQVSADFFRLFGAPFALGRGFTRDEDRPEGERVAVLSYGFWARQYGNDPQILGRTISLSGDSFLIVGVIARGFDISEFGPTPDVWVPFQLDPDTTDQGHYFNAAARLQPGIALDQARARVQLSATDFRTRFPNAIRPNEGFSVTPYRDAIVQNARPVVLVLLVAVTFVLLIACANVANLSLVRAMSRHREIAIRAAIGAGRGRIVRQLLTESLILSVTGGMLGLLLGIAGMRALLSVNRAGLPRLGGQGPVVDLFDLRVLAFTALVAVATGLLFGILPALRSSRVDLTTALKESGGPAGTGLGQNKARAALVIVEVGLAVILLIGSALLTRTVVALSTVSAGFDAQNVLTMRMSLSGPRFVKSSSVQELVRDGVGRLGALPGVDVASATCCVPLQGGYGLPFLIVGRALQDGPFHGGGAWVTISPRYFDVFRIPVRQGRAFTERDDAGAPPVVVINEAMAKQYWKDGNPLADRLVIGRGVMREFADEQPRQIVGVVADSRDGGLNNTPGPRMFIPQAQVPDTVNALNLRLTPMAWVIRTRVEPHSVSGAAQEQLRQATGLPVTDVRTMDEIVSISTSRQRFNMLLMAVFGGGALLLAAIGLYGLMSYSVEQRRQEIGVRLAIGSPTGRIRQMIVSQGMRLVVVGVVVGLASAFGLARVLASQLFGVEARDPLVFTFVPVLLLAVALIAVWVPAARASRVDPLTALRCE
jgi:predicted permease